MDNIPRSNEDIEAHIRDIQSKKKELAAEINDKGVGLGESGFFDSEIYDGGGGKGKYEGYVTSIAANDESDDEDEDVGYSQKRTGFGAPVIFLNDLTQSEKDYDPFADKRRPTIADREDEYRQKRLRMNISPERVDPFADGEKTSDLNARGYTQIMKEQMLKRKEHELRKKILDKSKDGSLKSTNCGVSAPKKRGRWDQKVAEVVVPSKKKTIPVSTDGGSVTPAWDADVEKRGGKEKKRKNLETSSDEEKKKSHHAKKEKARRSSGSSEEDRRHKRKKRSRDDDDRKNRKNKSDSSDYASRKRRLS